MAVGLCKAMSQVSWCFRFVFRNSMSVFRTLESPRWSGEHSLHFSLSTVCSENPSTKHLVSFFFFKLSVVLKCIMEQNVSSLDGLWFVVLEWKDRVWLSSALLMREVKEFLFVCLFLEVTFKQRETSVNIGRKFGWDLGKSFKSRRCDGVRQEGSPRGKRYMYANSWFTPLYNRN